MACSHEHFEKAAKPKDFFRVLEGGIDYKEMEKIIQKALENQWHDAVVSGLLNTVFSKYKTFFVNTRGVKIKLQKAAKKQLGVDDDEEITSIDDLKDQERRALQSNKISLPVTALKLSPLLSFLRKNVDSNIKSVNSYYSLTPTLRGYLKRTANKGGQTIIDQIKPTKPTIFRLSKKDYVDKISSRVSTLVKGLDVTTKKRLVNELVKGIKAGETKAEMTKRLTKIGTAISKARSKIIVATETEAAAEWMRYETASRNGAQMKVWDTASDERVCPSCAPLDGVKIPIDEDFKEFPFEGKYPPVHTSCRCSVHYEIDNNYCSNYVKREKSPQDKLEELFQKAKKPAAPYKPDKQSKIATCVNPDNVWAGGESNVGVDREVGNYYDDIKSTTDKQVKAAMLSEARHNLTNEGYAQLRLALGMSQETLKIKSKAEALELAGENAKLVYHGTTLENWNSIYDSDRFRVGSGISSYGKGVYFGTTLKIAESYAQTRTSETVVKGAIKDSVKFKVFKDNNAFSEYVNMALPKGNLTPDNISKAIQDDGYSGAIISNRGFVVVFNPNDIVIYK